VLGTKALFYPPDLIKTRLQVQSSTSKMYNFNYKGPWDAARKIWRADGPRGLYRGFAVSNLGVLVLQLYITSFEISKLFITDQMGPQLLESEAANVAVSSSAGLVAAVTAQVLGTPIRVILQNVQCQTPAAAPQVKTVGAAATPLSLLPKRRTTTTGSPLHNPRTRLGGAWKSRYTTTAVSSVPKSLRSMPSAAIVRQLVAQHGVAHFWKGFSTSVLMYAPTSAIWWTLYPIISSRVSAKMNQYSPNNSFFSYVMTKAFSGSLAASVTCLATNPLDVVRTRHHLLMNSEQEVATAVSRQTQLDVCRSLIKQEGLAGLYRGLSMRAVKFCMSSFALVLIYEGVKEHCRLE